MTTSTRSLIALSALFAFAAAASASVVTSSGQAQIISPPASCLPGALNGFNAFAWDEQSNVTLNNQLVDMTNNPGSSSSPVPGLISGQFDSHFIHYENVPGVINASGSFTFSGQIIAVIYKQSELDITDPNCGAFGTVYPTGYLFRGLNTSSVITLNNNVLNFNFTTFTPTQDVIQIRVLTHTVPTPSASLALGAAGLLAARRRRK